MTVCIDQLMVVAGSKQRRAAIICTYHWLVPMPTESLLYET